MSKRNAQCPKCGILQNTEHDYYTEDFALAILHSQNIILSWCRNCSHIAEFKIKRLLGVFGPPKMRLTDVYHLDDLRKKDYAEEEMNELKGIFNFHVHRMIWYSIDSHAKLEFGTSYSRLKTLEYLLANVNPISAAVCILAVSNTNQSVSLEDQLLFATYMSTDDWNFKEQIVDLLKESEHLKNRDLVLEILSEAKSFY